MFTRNGSTNPAWFCVRSQPKHEHIAAAHLRRQFPEEVDVFNPRLRIRRRTRRGVVWFVESLFPGYLFARFDPDANMQLVKSSPGVTTVVSFGVCTPTIPDVVIEMLQADFGPTEIYEVGDDIRPGDRITIATGPFRGLKATVLSVLPSAERLRVLLEFLGRNTSVELKRQDVVTGKSSAQLLATF